MTTLDHEDFSLLAVMEERYNMAGQRGSMSEVLSPTHSLAPPERSPRKEALSKAGASRVDSG